ALERNMDNTSLFPRLLNQDKDRDGDNFDRQTYLYDDGTEIDSVYVEDHQKDFCKALQQQCMTILYMGGSMCGVVLVSLLIWFIFGYDFFDIFLRPQEIQDNGITYYFKYLGGGIIYFITSIFRTIGNVLTMPTQQVYQSAPEHYRWPAMQQ
ncbi:hypothetical protein NQ318_015441, partial [Aromia moschata]